MAEVDTSSYPKAALPVSPLEVAGKLGAIQQQKLSIDQAKLDQANQGLTYLARAMASLGPNATKEQYKAAGDQVTRQLGLPPEKTAIWNEQVDASPDGPTFFKRAMSQIASHQEMLNINTGANSTQDNGATKYQGKTDVLTGGFVPATKMAVQPAPGTEFYQGGQKMGMGPSGPEGIQPASGAPPALPVSPGSTAPIVPKSVRSLPVAPLASGPTGPTKDITDQVPTTVSNRIAGAYNTAAPPMFEEGKKNLNEAQLRASGLNQTNKPAIQALDILKNANFSTGPLTDKTTEIMAGLKAFGLVDTKLENDPTAARQELEKKLAQFVGNSPIAGRSDAAQTLAEAGSPNPKKQILPALIKLTRDAVALNRVEAAKALTFEGNDYTKVGEHFANFPQFVDERAFSLDMMEPKERDGLVKKMALQYKNGDASEKKSAEKFLNSLKMSKKLGYYD